MSSTLYNNFHFNNPELTHVYLQKKRDVTKRSWPEEGLNFHHLFHKKRCFLAPLQQTIIENNVTKGEIAQNVQFPLSPQCFQLYLMIKLLFMETCSCFCQYVWKIVCCGIVICGKGLKVSTNNLSHIASTSPIKNNWYSISSPNDILLKEANENYIFPSGFSSCIMIKSED